MQYIPYIIVVLLIAIIIKKHRIIRRYIGKEPIYVAVILMMIANLSYISYVQYAIRMLAIAYSSLVIIASFKNIGNNKKLCGSSTEYIYIIYIVFVCYAFISTIWSIQRLETLVKSIEILIDMTLAYLIVKRRGEKGVVAYSVIYILFASTMVLSALLGAVVSPSNYLKSSSGILGFQLKPYLSGTDAIAAIAAVVIIFLLNTPRWRFKWTLYAASTLVIILAQARTSIAILGVVVGIHMISNKVKPIYVLIFIAGVFALYFNFDKFLIYFNRGAYQQNIQNLNGRRVIWGVADQLIKESPMIGYGYGAGGYLASSQVMGLDNTHNSYYEIAMGLGYIGVGLVVIQVVYSLLRVGKKIIKLGFSALSFEMMFLAHIMIRSYTSTGVGSWSSPEYMCWLFFLIVISCKTNGRGYKDMFLRGLQEIQNKSI